MEREIRKTIGSSQEAEIKKHCCGSEGEKYRKHISMEEFLSICDSEQMKTMEKKNAARRNSLNKNKAEKKQNTPELKNMFDEALEALETSKNVSAPQIEKLPIDEPGATKSAKNTLDYMATSILGKVKIINYCGNLYRYNGRTYLMIKDGDDLLKLVRLEVSHNAFGSNSVRHFADLLAYMKADPRLIPENCESKVIEARRYIVFHNGVLNLMTMELLSHSSQYLTFYELDAEWRHDANPKRFKKFLLQASGSDEEIALRVLESMGYLLSPVNEGKYFFVMGTAQNSGKSTLGELLRKLIGDEFVISRSTYQMGNRFSLGDIQGKLLNMALDLPKGKLNPVTVSVIKQITGGDVISTEQKYEKIKEVHSNMRFLFASNYPVTVPPEDDDDAFWDRMVIIPFLYSVNKSEADSQLIQKLEQEKSDIVSFCLSAFGKVLRNNCIFSNCAAAERMKESWRYDVFDDTSTAEAFVKQYIDVTGNANDGIYSKELYDRYRDFCVSNGSSCLVYNNLLDWFSGNLEGCYKKRIHKTGSNPMSGLTGIRWKIREEA
jgi:putative DNA primase/helicase